VCQAEEARLRTALLEKRGLIARVTNQPPVNICGDRLLDELCVQRPGTLEALAKCEGAHQKFCSMFGNAFLEVIRYVNRPAHPTAHLTPICHIAPAVSKSRANGDVSRRISDY
jgi:ribonuclease D